MKLTWERQLIRPRHRFATSQWATDEKETIILRLEHDGVVGLGEAVPSTLYGQTLESTEAVFAELGGRPSAAHAPTTQGGEGPAGAAAPSTGASAAPAGAGLAPRAGTGIAPSAATRSSAGSREPAGPAVLGDDPFAIEPIMVRARARFDAQRAALDALDAALHDWVGRKLGVPVWRLLGLERPHKQTTFTIGVADPDETRMKIDEALAAGFDALKIKVGVEFDHETLTYLRKRFDGPLFLDANQAWTPAQALKEIPRLAPYRPTIIEQPLRREDWPHFKELRGLRVAPIFADESCERPADVLRLHGCVDGVNIKFNKCGGIREALRMIHLARALDMQVMLGCFVCSSLAIAPALTVASLVDHADLDGALLLAEDPFEGITRTGGTLTMSDQPGLGVRRK